MAESTRLYNAYDRPVNLAALRHEHAGSICADSSKRTCRSSAFICVHPRLHCSWLDADRVPPYSCTTSISTSKGASGRALGCTKNTVVPREPGRGAASRMRRPRAVR